MSTKMTKPTAGTLLFVTDLVSDSRDALDLAYELSVSRGICLEMVHVVDLSHAQSRPDAQMDIQFQLEMLARSVRHFKKNVASILLFGSPDDVIAKRAKEIRAALIAFAFKGHPAAATQEALAKRVRSKVSCPVVFLPTTTF